MQPACCKQQLITMDNYYEIILKNTKVRGYLLSGWVIVFLSSLSQIFVAFAQTVSLKRFESLGCLAMIILMLVVSRGHKFNFKDRDHAISIAYSISAILWFSWKLYVPAIMLLVIFFLYTIATRKFQVYINKKAVYYATFPKRKIAWADLNNVLMKDGLLTIDFKDNRLLQSEIEGDDFFDEKEFNEFCRKQIKDKN